MKILHIINSLSAGGAERLVSELASKQSEDFEVTVFTFKSSNDIFQNNLAHNVKFKTTKNNSFYSFSNLKYLYEIIKINDIIHAHLFPSFYLVSLLSLFFQRKKNILRKVCLFSA